MTGLAGRFGARNRMMCVTFVALLLAGCGSATPPQPTQAAGYITRAEYGADWPFTVPAGTLHCYDDPLSARLFVTFSHEGEPGVEYALNGSAITFGFPELDSTILTDYPDVINTLPLIDRGLALCD